MKGFIMKTNLIFISLFASMLMGCGGGAPKEGDPQLQALKNEYESDFEWVVDELVDFYDEYNIEAKNFRLRDVSEIYVTSTNEANGADRAATLVIEYTVDTTAQVSFKSGVGPTLKKSDKWVDVPYSLECGNGVESSYGGPSYEMQLAVWNGERQLPCLEKLKIRLENHIWEK
jgi:hypothetical protein